MANNNLTIPSIPMDNYIIIADGTSQIILNFPLYPDEIQEGYSAEWSPQQIIGRPVPVGTYTGAGYRSVSFSFETHRELHEDIDNLLLQLRKACYPTYPTHSGDGYIPRTTIIQIGNFIFTGYITSVNYTWRKPIIDNKYQVCSVSLQMNAIDAGQWTADGGEDKIG